MSEPTITEEKDLLELCERLGTADLIGIDTEFVSEDTFYPELCLIQIATRDEMAVIDAMGSPRRGAILANARRWGPRDRVGMPVARS